MIRQEASSTLHPFHKRLARRIRAIQTGMCMIVEEIPIYDLRAQRLENAILVRKVVHITRTRRPQRRRHILRILHKSWRRVDERPRLPGIVRRLRRDDDVRPLGDIALGCLDQIPVKGMHDVGFVIVDARAGLISFAGTVGSSVVGGTERSAVVVAELDDDEVAGLNLLRDGLEPAFFVERACRATSDCVVDDWNIKRVFQVLAPA